MYFPSPKLLKTISTLGVTTLFLLGFLGLTNLGMDMGMDGTMTSPCPFATGMSVCNMSPLEHISAWQNTFTSLPRQQQDIESLLLLLLISLVVVAWTRYIYPPLKNLLRQFLHILHQEYIPLGNFLQEAFSNGILNPKIF